ncbi:MAG: repeat-containing protein [Planctomycetaceae bacterium]|nr:repeat-containing protein [Planctomycetaceae bacterium]
MCPMPRNPQFQNAESGGSKPWFVILLVLLGLVAGFPVLGQSVKTKSTPTITQSSKDQAVKEKLKPAAAAIRVEESLDFAAKPEVSLLSPLLIYSAILSNDGAWAAAGVSDWTKPGELILWDVATRQVKYQLAFKQGVRALAFSPDNRLLAAGTYTNEVVLVDVAKSTLLARWTAHAGGVNGLAFSPNGKLLASASVDRTVKLWDVILSSKPTEGLPLRATLSGHTDMIFTLGFALDGKTLYSAGKDQKVFLWNVETRQLTTVWEDFQSVIESLAVSPDGNSVALGLWNGTVELRNTMDGSVSAKLNHSTKGSFTTSVRFAKSSPILASAAADGVIKIWELPEGRPVTEIAAHQGPAFACALTADGSRLLSGGFDGQVYLWDLKTKKRLFQLQQSEEKSETNAAIMAMTWARDRSLFVTSHADGSIRVRLPKTGRTLKLIAQSINRNSLALSPDNKFLAAAGQDPVVSLWDISGEIGQPVLLKGHTTPATSVVFTIDGKRVFAGAADGSVREWKTTNGIAGLVLEAGKEPVLSLDCAADGNWLAATQGADIPLWNLSQLERRPWLTLPGQHGPVSILAFAPNQPLLASTTDDNRILLWNLARLKPAGAKVSADNIDRRLLSGHEGTVTCLSYSMGGKWLASGSQDRTVRLWSTDTGRLLQVLKADSSSQSVAFGTDASTLSAVAREKALRTWRGSPSISFAPKEGRYIKLKSLSEVTGGPCAVVAEIRVLEDGAFISNQDWKLVSVDAADAKLPGTLAFDGRPETHWHTPYQSDVVLQPHHIVIDLGKTYRLSGLSVLHRSDIWGPNGSIKDYEFYVGNDVQDFGRPVSKGQFAAPVLKK